MNDFCTGLISMGFLVAAAFFLRFWRESRDRLFAFFSAAFFLMALNRRFTGLVENETSSDMTPYLIRLLAYLIILAAIIDKNFRRT